MKTFVVTDENVINHYGFRVLTSGIDTSQFNRNPLMYYMHNRREWNPDGTEVIGGWKKLKTNDAGQMTAVPWFDDKESFAALIGGKVERNVLRMASIGIEIIETSEDPKYLLQGQARATVTKCRLVEISIVDQGANDNALSFYDADNNKVELKTALASVPSIQKQKTETKDNMSTSTIALALGLKSDATEIEQLQKINDLKKSNTDLSSELTTLKKEQQTQQDKESKELIEKASVQLGLTGDAKESFEESYTTLFKADHQSAKSALSNLFNIASAKKTSNTELSAFMKDVGGSGDSSDKESTFDYLQKHNQQELARIKENDPQLYTQLAADYKKGVRYHK
ncbi:hypothetical protein HN014_08095 [Aquimarina sp. TRL1]|uniref:hypothetical protein n=1 Tax=Aquimarina sp. (strain TRL1) TaxID=2736252 RepID=UPI00158AAAE6|nr:hypothetical protein [Aquimarina sp. TRL1]QKX04879.1 hypothetical protein HN014_08095 [Aquimarina sp. TRL1]